MHSLTSDQNAEQKSGAQVCACQVVSCDLSLHQSDQQAVNFSSAGPSSTHWRAALQTMDLQLAMQR